MKKKCCALWIIYFFALAFVQKVDPQKIIFQNNNLVIVNLSSMPNKNIKLDLIYKYESLLEIFCDRVLTEILKQWKEGNKKADLIEPTSLPQLKVTIMDELTVPDIIETIPATDESGNITKKQVNKISGKEAHEWSLKYLHNDNELISIPLFDQPDSLTNILLANYPAYLLKDDGHLRVRKDKLEAGFNKIPSAYLAWMMHVYLLRGFNSKDLNRIEFNIYEASKYVVPAPKLKTK